MLREVRLRLRYPAAFPSGCFAPGGHGAARRGSHRLLCSGLALLLGASLPAEAKADRGHRHSRFDTALRKAAQAQKAPATSPQGDPAAVGAVERGIEAWRKGQYAKVRRELAAFLSDNPPLVGRENLEAAYRYLADAALLDETLPLPRRREIARTMIERELEANPDWRPPPGLHSQNFYGLVATVRADRRLRDAAECVAERVSCTAELKEVQVQNARLQTDNKNLQKSVAEQIVVVEEKVARNRALALLPAGIGHFYNGNKVLGYSFLGAEALIGITGLSLMLYRIYQLDCERTNGFRPRSLKCDVDREDANLTRNVRDAEQVFGILFLASIAIDIIVAQWTFEPYETTGRKTLRRRELTPKTSPPPKRRRSSKRGARNLLRLTRPYAGWGEVGLRLRRRF